MASKQDSTNASVSDADRLASVRRELQRGDVRLAVLHFQRLPANALGHRVQWLDAVLGDLFTHDDDAFDLSTAVRFLEQLSDGVTALDGCLLLHRAITTLESGRADDRALPVVSGLAKLVHRLRCELTGKARARAETYWYTWFRPTHHAIVKAKPVVIESSSKREPLFAASATYAYDSDRRNVFCWRYQWTPKLVHKEQWLLVPVEGVHDRFYLQTVAYGERLYVDTVCILGSDPNGHGVFAWRNSTNPELALGESAHWQLLPIGDRANDEYAIYNRYAHAYLSAGGEVFDESRRFLTTTPAAFNGADGTWRDEVKWRVRPQQLTPMEKGVTLFYEKRYVDADCQLSKALEIEAELEFVPKFRCLAYRLASRASGPEPRDLTAIRSDFDTLERLGGASAARLHGYYELWRKGALTLGVPLPLDLEKLEPAACVRSTTALASHVAQGAACLAQKDYKQALAAFREVTAIHPSANDTVRRTLKATAQLNCAKCFYAMGHVEVALLMLDVMTDECQSCERNQANACCLPLDVEVRVLLLSARCRRTLRQFDDAVALLERALDRLASQPVSAEGEQAGSHSWFHQWALMEMRLVGIFQKELLDRLVSKNACEGKAIVATEFDLESSATVPGDSEAEQLVNLFQCPLTLEFMRDPVITPSGNTYERVMIERHIESVGAWDPLTRARLTKRDLYPNRALKTLMTTMLSEHRLGRLLKETA